MDQQDHIALFRAFKLIARFSIWQGGKSQAGRFRPQGINLDALACTERGVEPGNNNDGDKGRKPNIWFHSIDLTHHNLATVSGRDNRQRLGKISFRRAG